MRIHEQSAPIRHTSSVNEQTMKLLEPFQFKSLTLRNRMVMGAMHTRIETLDRPVERMTAFFEARAKGEVGLILTGGFAPNEVGKMERDAPVMDAHTPLEHHLPVTDAVHAAGSHIVMQLLHAGRYAKHDQCVAPSAIRAPINRHIPRAMTPEDIRSTIMDFAVAAKRAQEAGYDGVEIMGSEGYLLNEFTCRATNTRADDYGGSFANRIRLPIEIVQAIRLATGPTFLIVFRLSSIDLVEGGMTGEETAEYARALEQAGVDMLNTGIGWHEAAIPTIAQSVPRAAWAFAIRNIKQAITIPVIASNRINTPEVAEALLADGTCDFVSMARPFLADPDFAKKVRLGLSDRINTCIGCNQACLDHIFTERTATCMVNPFAGRELDLVVQPAAQRRRIAVVGGGAAGMACASQAAARGHHVTLFEAQSSLGGQVNLAKVVPGKSEFNEMLRYFRLKLQDTGVDVRLNTTVTTAHLAQAGFDDIVIATGVTPRVPQIQGIDHPSVVRYDEVLSGKVTVGHRVAILGAGGIGFDMAEYLVGDPAAALVPQQFLQDWRVDVSLVQPGGLSSATAPSSSHSRRQVHLFQRKADKPGATLGKSTGWILKAKLRKARVTMVSGVIYERIDDEGLHYSLEGQQHCLPVDHVVLCTGQESNLSLMMAMRQAGITPYVIGGAQLASELDAVRAIDEGTRLGLTI